LLCDDSASSSLQRHCIAEANWGAAQGPAIFYWMNGRRVKSLEGKFAEGYHQGIAVFLDLARGQPRTHSLDRSLGTSAMSPIPPRSGSRPSRNDDLLRLGEQAFRFGAEAYGQWWTITGRSLRHEIKRLVRGAKASAPPSALLQGLASGYVNWLGGLVAMAPSVAEKAAMEFAQGSHADPEPFLGDEDAGPVTEGDYFEVAGKPFAMPARVLDASQGWAMFFVSTKAADDSLGAARDYLSAFDAGGGRTPLTIVGVDYRNSDFGVYPEFVVALTVTAKGDPAGQPFVYYLAIVVTQEFTKEAAQIVWGLDKIVAPRLTASYAADSVRFGLPDRRGKALSIRFPRFGDGHSFDIPTFSVSLRCPPMAGGDARRRNESPVDPERRTYWAMTTKSGSGEGTQIGGSVLLELGAPSGGSCLCSDGKSACLCDTLRTFDIAERLPAANGWTERQTGVFGPPRLLDLPLMRGGEASTVGKHPGELGAHH
jgi:hypothetical protein